MPRVLRTEAPFTYASLCSGIEAATIAWHPLGWKPAFFSEIEPFPSAVLARHWPDVPNMGDMTRWREWDPAILMSVDALVGGTPCQSWSVAGKGAGKDDPRGMLTFCFLEIIEHVKPKWVVWENVPGILSTKGGTALVEFLDRLLGLGYLLNADILDARFFLLAQRRRRIFLACQRADILMKQKTPTSANVGASMFAGILLDILDDLLTGSGSGRGKSAAKSAPAADGLRRKTKCFSAHGAELLETWLTNCAEAWASAAPVQSYSESKAGDGKNTADSSGLSAAIESSVSAPGETDRSAGGQSSSTSQSLKKCLADLFALANASTTSTGSRTIIGRQISSFVGLLPIIGNSIALSATSCPHSLNAASLLSTALQKAITYARRTAKQVLPDARVHGFWTDFAEQAERAADALKRAGERTRAGEIFSFGESVRRDSPPSREKGEGASRGIEIGPSGGRFTDLNPTLDTRAKDGPIRNQLAGAAMVPTFAIQERAISENPNAGPDGVGVKGDGTAYTLEARQVPQAVAAFWNGEQVTQTLDAVLAKGQTMPEKNRFPAVLVPATARTLKAEGFDASEDGTGRGVPLVPCHTTGAGFWQEGFGTLRAREQDSHENLVAAMQVRRLLPVECERLQGFPDNHTLIPWRKKPAEECPDGPRYKAIGNSMAVPVMNWIGRRIQRFMEGTL